MRDLCDDTAGSGRIRTRYRLIQLGDSQALNDLFLFLGIADHTPVILDLDLAARVLFFFLCHNFDGTPPSWRHYCRQDAGVPLDQLVDLLTAKPSNLDRVFHP